MRAMKGVTCTILMTTWVARLPPSSASTGGVSGFAASNSSWRGGHSGSRGTSSSSVARTTCRTVPSSATVTRAGSSTDFDAPTGTVACSASFVDPAFASLIGEVKIINQGVCYYVTGHPNLCTNRAKNILKSVCFLFRLIFSKIKITINPTRQGFFLRRLPAVGRSEWQLKLCKMFYLLL